MEKLRIISAPLFILLTCVFVAALFSVGSLRANADENRECRTRIVGYLPDWSYSEYKNIDFSALTHINIAFCNVKGGALSCGIPYVEMKAVVDKARANGVKIFAALGGGGYGEAYRELISGSDKINSLNEKIVSFCEKYNLDGVDLDIELGSNDAIWKNYGAWVSSLREICDARGWELSTATAQWVAGNVNAETFALFDFVSVMAYDDDSRGVKSHSSYEFAVECLDYFHGVKKIPKDKLVLGVPLYGRGYDENGSLDWNSYLSFSKIIEKDTSNFNSDEYMGVAYTGANSMREKCGLAKEYGGVMIWEITLDAEGEYSLLSLIRREMFPPLIAPDTSAEKEVNVALIVSAAALCFVSAVTVTVFTALFLKKGARN